MKKILILAAATAMLAGCGKTTRFVIEGDVPGLAGPVSLINERGDTLASAPVTEGKFTMKGQTDAPALALLNDPMKPVALIFVENGTIKVAGESIEAITATGTPANDGYTTWNELNSTLMERVFQTASDEERKAIFDDYAAKSDSLLNNNMDNNFGLYMLTNYINTWDGSKIIATLDEFSPEMQSTELAGEIRAVAQGRINSEIGNAFTDITLPDAEGNNLSLSDYVGKGKWVLLDFWASWCSPCMQEVPSLREAYEMFRDKGLVIFGVSFDRTDEAWKKALEANEMTWINVSAVDDEEGTVGKAYAVNNIPANFLIGPDGTILYKNLFGEELISTLSDIFGAKEGTEEVAETGEETGADTAAEE